MQLLNSACFVLSTADGEFIWEVGIVTNVEKRPLTPLVIDGALWISYSTTDEVIYHVSEVIRGMVLKDLCNFDSFGLLFYPINSLVLALLSYLFIDHKD